MPVLRVTEGVCIDAAMTGSKTEILRSIALILTLAELSLNILSRAFLCLTPYLASIDSFAIYSEPLTYILQDISVSFRDGSMSEQSTSSLKARVSP